jgi:hypothetical protein
MTQPRAADDPRTDLLIDPLDFLLLERMSPEGTMHFGAYPDGATAKQLSEMFDGHVRSGTIGMRCRVLSLTGYAVKLKGVGTGGKSVWQRTEQGEKALKKWRAKQPKEQKKEAEND